MAAAGASVVGGVDLRDAMSEAVASCLARLLPELRAGLREEVENGFASALAKTGHLDLGLTLGTTLDPSQLSDAMDHEWKHRHMRVFPLHSEDDDLRPRRLTRLRSGVRKVTTVKRLLGKRLALGPSAASPAQRDGQADARVAPAPFHPGAPSPQAPGFVCACPPEEPPRLPMALAGTAREASPPPPQPAEKAGAAPAAGPWAAAPEREPGEERDADFMTVQTSSWSTQDGRGRRSVEGRLRKVVTSAWFESCVSLIIILNAVSLGVATDINAKSGNHAPALFVIVDNAFALIFLVELCIRVAAYGRAFWTNRDWRWNWFDTCIILFQILCGILSAAWTSMEKAGQFDVAAARATRLIQLARILRIARILRRIPKLRVLVVSIVNSMATLGWTMVLLFIVIYIFSLYLTQAVTDLTYQVEEKSSNFDILARDYGSIGDTILVLFMAITGGANWQDLCAPLMIEMTPWVGLAFSMYIAFCQLAMLNVVTGVFVESVLQSQESDRDLFLLNNAKELFATLEGGVRSLMSWEIFESKLSTPEMLEFFKAINVDSSEAEGLFQLLDMDKSGAISAEEFLNGALRLRGPAKSLDMALVLQEVHRLSNHLRSLQTKGRAAVPGKSSLTLNGFGTQMVSVIEDV